MKLYGTFKDGLQTLHPHVLPSAHGPIAELPVTTAPLIKAPFHGSYLMFLAMRSEALAFGYGRTCLQMCRLTGTAPSVLLHPTAVLGSDEVSGMDFFPGMALPSARKTDFMLRYLRWLAERFAVEPMQVSADRILEQNASDSIGHALSNLESGGPAL